MVVERISAYHVRKVFQHRHFPRPPEGTDLSGLNLENRTRRCLVREGFDERPETLGDHTIGEIMSMRAFGPRCLVDLLSALESARPEAAASAAGRTACARAAGAGGGVDRGGGAAGRVARRPGRAERRSAFRPVDAARGRRGPERPGVGRAASWRGRRTRPTRATWPGRSRQLAERIEGMSRLTIEQELIEVFAPDPRDRNAEILIGYYGWDDGRQHTLTEVGDRFGITRERIRQICAKLTRKPKNLAAALAPVMDRALALVEERLPGCGRRDRGGAAPPGLDGRGHALGKPGHGRQVVGPAGRVSRGEDRSGPQGESAAGGAGEARSTPTPAIADAAKKDVYFHGLATIERDPTVGGRQVRPASSPPNWSRKRSAWSRAFHGSTSGRAGSASRASASTGCPRRSTRCWPWPAR